MEKKHKKRIITLLLSLTLVVTYMPASFLAYAVDEEPAVTQVETTEAGTDVADPGQDVSDPGADAGTTDGQPGDDSANINAPDNSNTDATQQDGRIVDYAENDGVSAFVVHGYRQQQDSGS